MTTQCHFCTFHHFPFPSATLPRMPLMRLVSVVGLPSARAVDLFLPPRNVCNTPNCTNVLGKSIKSFGHCKTNDWQRINPKLAAVVVAPTAPISLSSSSCPRNVPPPNVGHIILFGWSSTYQQHIALTGGLTERQTDWLSGLTAVEIAGACPVQPIASCLIAAPSCGYAFYVRLSHVRLIKIAFLLPSVIDIADVPYDIIRAERVAILDGFWSQFVANYDQ